MLVIVEAFRQPALGHLPEGLLEHRRELPGQLVLDGAVADLLPAVGEVRQVLRQVLVGLFCHRILQWERADVGWRALEHGDMAGTLVHQGRDQGDSRCPGTDHDDLLPGEVEVLGPVLRVDDLTAKVRRARELRRVALVVVVVAAADRQK